LATSTRRKKPAFTIRTVATKEDRKRPSVFMRLKTDEAFKGYALFEPDPELDDNTGYFEYYDHYDKQGNAYVPCTGENCPFCAANDNPSTRALTAWYFPQAADVKDKIKVFTMNFSTTQEMSDEAEDEGGVLGKMVRVKRLSDKGDYRVKITNDKPLTKAQTKEAMGILNEKFPNGLMALVERQLEVQMERLKALEAMEDDDDEDDEREERTTKSRRGRAASSKRRDEEDEDEDTEDEDEDEEAAAIEEQEFELVSVSKRNNSVKVEHDGETIELVGDEDEIDVSSFKKGDTAVISAEYDEDEEGWVLTTLSEVESDEDEDEDEEEEDEDENSDEDEDEDEDEDSDEEEDEEDEDESTAIEGVVYEVVRVEEADEILHLKNDDGRVKMWVGDGVSPNYDEVKKGASVKIDAQQDEEGDWIVMAVELAKKPRARRTAAAKTTTTRSRTTRKK